MGGIPSHYSVDLDFVSPLDLTGIPTGYQIDIKSLPKISIGLDPITVNPMDVSVRLKEIPSVRAHVPAAFTVGFSILGLQLASVRVCGEAQVITEPYIPNPCENCGGGIIFTEPTPQPTGKPGTTVTVPSKKVK
jgi:hypothetical protein